MIRVISLRLFCSLLPLLPVLTSCAQTSGRHEAVLEEMACPLGDTSFRIRLTTFGDRSWPLLLKLHDNEQTAEEAARRQLEKTGGRLITLLNGGRRLVDFPLLGRQRTIDPNRIFSSAGIAATLRLYGGYHRQAAASVDSFARSLLRLLPDTVLLIAVHNNTDGSFSIRDYLPGARLQKEAAAAFHAPDQDPDDFVLTTEADIFALYRKLGYNAVLQATDPTDDGSLSVYYGRQGRRYVNIETEHGHLAQQENLIRVLLEHLSGNSGTPERSH